MVIRLYAIRSDILWWNANQIWFASRVIGPNERVARHNTTDFLPIHTVNKNTAKWQIVRIQFGSHVSKHPQNVREFKWKMVCVRIELTCSQLCSSSHSCRPRIERNGIFIGHLPNGDALNPAVVDDNNAHK